MHMKLVVSYRSDRDHDLDHSTSFMESCIERQQHIRINSQHAFLGMSSVTLNFATMNFKIYEFVAQLKKMFV